MIHHKNHDKLSAAEPPLHRARKLWYITDCSGSVDRTLDVAGKNVVVEKYNGHRRARAHEGRGKPIRGL